MAILLYVALVAIVVGVMLASYFLGERHHERATDFPYESGIVATGSARVRFPVQFYLIAMFFVIFDVESVFIVVWSVAVRDLGFLGLMHMSIFVATLLLALFYLWRSGALTIAPKQAKIHEDS